MEKEARMKKMKKLPVILPALLSLALFAAPNPLEASEAGIDFNIRFFDRRIYYAENDPIFIQATITNNSVSTYRFKLADDRIFSLDFDVRTVSNRPLEPAEALIRRRTQSQQVFFREIAVESGESFSFVEDLRSYVTLSEPGTFVVKACIYPELLRSDYGIPAFAGSAPEILESRRLNLNIRPPVITGPDGVPLEMDVATGAVLVRERLAPDKAVEYMLSARQKSQWEKFFLYIDLETMLSRDAVRQRKWLAESEEGRRRMVEQFRHELENSETDGISLIPSEFIIERTQYNSSEGSVSVLQKFQNPYYTELKRYTYILRLKDSIWTIVDYSVINLGTE